MKKHDSIRGHFAYELYNQMIVNKNIIVVTGDLGYAMFDDIRKDFPTQFYNVGAAEQSMIGIACGLALEGKIPVVYSITNFLLYRPFETIRNYVNHEKIPVKLVGSGREKDYAHDGISHWPLEQDKLLELLPNIKTHIPETKEQVTTEYISNFIYEVCPSYMNLRR